MKANIIGCDQHIFAILVIIGIGANQMQQDADGIWASFSNDLSYELLASDKRLSERDLMQTQFCAKMNTEISLCHLISINTASAAPLLPPRILVWCQEMTKQAQAQKNRLVPEENCIKNMFALPLGLHLKIEPYVCVFACLRSCFSVLLVY